LLLYKNNLEDISSDILKGFFVDWPNPPSAQTHLKLLKDSSKDVVTLDEQSNQIVGFITAISDGALSAYIPFLKCFLPIKVKALARN